MEILKGRVQGREIVFDPPLDPVQWPNGQKVIIYLDDGQLSETQSEQIRAAKEAAKDRGEAAAEGVIWGLVKRVEEGSDE